MKYLKIWTSLLGIIQTLQYDEIGRLFEMMLKYADAGEEPQEDYFEGNERFLWPVVKRDIDMMNEKAEKMRENGSKGGRPKTKNNQEEPDETKENQEEANENKQNPIKEKKRKEIESKVNESSSKNIVTLKRFIPPTADEVKAYCDERGVFLIDPQQFVDYYEARGWMLKKNQKMVDWKAAVRTWEKNERDRMKEKYSNYELPL